MVGFTTNRGNFIQNNVFSTTTNSNICLAYTLWNDFISNGFTLVAADNTDSTGATDLTKSTIVVLQPSLNVDPLWETNKWYVAFRIDDVGAIIWNNNILDSGGHPTPVYYNNSQLQITTFGWNSSTSPTINSTARTISGMLSSWSPILPGRMYPNQGTIGQYVNIPSRISAQRPYGYFLTIVKRGFALSIYDQTIDNINYNGIYCVQRGVDSSGKIKTTGKTPLYCVTNVCNASRIYTPTSAGTTDVEVGPGPTSTWEGWIVRESDTIVPDLNNTVYYGNSTGGVYDELGYPMMACNISSPSEFTGRYVHRFPSYWDGPVTTDTGEYLIVLPYGICSSRYTYTEEIDLIAVSKADAYQLLQQIPITIYGDNRTYSALSSNQSVSVAHGHSAIRGFILVGGSDFSS